MYDANDVKLWHTCTKEGDTKTRAGVCESLDVLRSAVSWEHTYKRSHTLHTPMLKERISRLLPKHPQVYIPAIVSVAALLSLLGVGVWILSTVAHERQLCEDHFVQCIADEREGLGSGAVITQAAQDRCASLVDISRIPEGIALACEITVARPVLGMPAWKWLLMVGMLWPLDIAAQIVAHCATRCVAMCVQLRLRQRWVRSWHARHTLTELSTIPLYFRGLETPLSRLIFSLACLGTWFAMAATPTKWAERAREWNLIEGRAVWSDVFADVHFVTWRLLLMYILLAATISVSRLVGRILCVRSNYAHRANAGVAHVFADMSALHALLRATHGVTVDSVSTKAAARLQRMLDDQECDAQTAGCIQPVLEEAGLAMQALPTTEPVEKQTATCWRRAIGAYPSDVYARLAAAGHSGERGVADWLACMLLFTLSPVHHHANLTFNWSAGDPCETALRYFLSHTHSEGSEACVSLVALAERLMRLARAVSKWDVVVRDRGIGVVREVESVVFFACASILVFSAIALFNPNTLAKVWTGASAVLITLSFVFGNSLRQLYENCVFLFMRHPFEEGDIVVIDGNKALVQSMHLRCVVVTRDNGARVNIPMHELLNATITNETRTVHIWDNVAFDVDTNSAKLVICSRVAARVADVITQNPATFAHGLYCVNLGSSHAQPAKATLTTWFTHAHCAPCDMLKLNARAHICSAVCAALTEAGVVCSSTHQIIGI